LSARGILPWTWVRDREAYQTRILSVLERTVVSPKDGEEKTFTVLKAPSWVNVLAITDDSKVVMVNQYRQGSREFSLELPGGVVEDGDALEESALRELMEETGYGCDSVSVLMSLNPNPAIFDNSITTFLARGARKVGEVSFDENEETEVRLVGLDELRDLFLAGAFGHALMAAPIGYFLALNPPA
jgi:8-oxo-dGTP pyrophosphatase MutT (NUDIX family)